MFFQVFQEFGQVLSAIVTKNIDKLRHVAKNIGSDGRLPVDVVDQVLNIIAKGKFFFVVFQPGDRTLFPVVRLIVNDEVWFRIVRRFVAVFLVDIEVSGARSGEGVRLEPFYTTRPPEFGVCDDVFPGSDINDLVIKSDKGVQFRSFSVAPQRDKFGRRNTHKCQFPVPEIGLNPGNAGLDRAFPQGFNLPAEGLVEDFRQCFAVCAVFGVDRPGLRQKVVRFLVNKFLQDRVFDLRV